MCGGGSLALREGQPRVCFSVLWVTAMPEGEGYPFDTLDDALYSGSSEERALARHSLMYSSRFSGNGFAAFLKAAPNYRNQTQSGCFDFCRSER
jgi:hypothetical protein